jgi:hypothetical protein
MMCVLIPMVFLVVALACSALEPQEATGSSDEGLARIRKVLTAPAIQLPAPTPELTFRVGIVERGRIFGSTLDRLNLPNEPVPPGGPYAFEQRQLLGNPWAGQPLIKVDMLPLVSAVVSKARSAYAGRATRAARIEVEQSLQEFCATNDC